MASAAEQLASSISFGNFQKATELKKRLWFTIGALILFRLLSFVPVPGIDPVAMNALYQTQSGGILDVFNTFSGGALERFSIVALGVMPYITASIVVQLGATLYGPWQALRKEGETGARSSISIRATSPSRSLWCRAISRCADSNPSRSARESRRSSRPAFCSRFPAHSPSSAGRCS